MESSSSFSCIAIGLKRLIKQKKGLWRNRTKSQSRTLCSRSFLKFSITIRMNAQIVTGVQSQIWQVCGHFILRGKLLHRHFGRIGKHFYCIKNVCCVEQQMNPPNSQTTTECPTVLIKPIEKYQSHSVNRKKCNKNRHSYNKILKIPTPTIPYP